MTDTWERAADPTPFATPTDPYGNPGAVAAGDSVDPDWGNATTTTVVRRFPDTTARDSWSNPPQGALCVTTDTDTVWQSTGAALAWVPIRTLARHFAADSTQTFIDTGISWNISDSWKWPVASVSRLTVNVGGTGWQAGYVPNMDIYSNQVTDPWIGGGFRFTLVNSALAVAAGNIGNSPTANPLRLPSATVHCPIPANQAGLVWTVRSFWSSASGAITWNGFVHAVLERIPVPSVSQAPAGAAGRELTYIPPDPDAPPFHFEEVPYIVDPV